MTCGQAGVTGTIDFQFAGANGPTIKVPISEMIWPLLQDDGTPSTFISGPNAGQEACMIGVQPASSLGQNAALLIGDTTLRSAYVVYDLYNARIGLAQTDFNSTTSNVVAFESAGAQIPSATTVTDESAVTQTASSGNGGVGASATAIQSAAGTGVPQFTGAAGPAFSSAATKVVSTGAATGTSSTKKGAGIAGPRPFAWEPVTVLGLSLGLVLMGGGMMTL